MAGILSMAGDRLKFDPLKEDPKKYEYDPYGKDAGKRVRTFDKNYGFAMLPEEKAVVDSYKGGLEGNISQQKKGVEQYKSEYEKAMTAADARAKGILEQARGEVDKINAPSLDIVPIRVVDASGKNVETVYNLPRSVADSISSNPAFSSAWVDDGKYFNVSVRGKKGGIIGNEIHKMLRDAEKSTRNAMDINSAAADTARKAGDIAIGSLEGEIAGRREIAQNAYNQSLAQGQQVSAELQGRLDTFMQDQRTAFQRGIQTNNGGIRTLLESGVLAVKGKKK